MDNHPSDIGILNENHTLTADLATGWKPKLKIIGPMPLNFDNKYIDKTIRNLLFSDASIFSVAYLGNACQIT
jgi:hypothetical protein